MPCIEVKTSVKLDNSQKNDLQKKLSDSISANFAKPKAYIMVNIEDEASLYMDENRLDKGAYISIHLLGQVAKTTCQKVSKDICSILQSDLGIDGTKVYITFHPVELWGWNGTMF